MVHCQNVIMMKKISSQNKAQQGAMYKPVQMQCTIRTVRNYLIVVYASTSANEWTMVVHKYYMSPAHHTIVYWK